MALDFLRSIERARFPMRILRAAQLLEAIVKEAQGPDEDDFVLVEKITWKGRTELAQHAARLR